MQTLPNHRFSATSFAAKKRGSTLGFGLFVAIGCCFTQPPVLVAQPPGIDPSRILTQIDQDDDGELSLEEFRELGQFIPRLQADNVSGFVFSNLDANNDGTLDATELERISAMQRGRSPADRSHHPIAGPVARNPLRSILPDSDGELATRQLTDAEERFFRERILPVMETRCYSCHSVDAEPLRGGLRLDSADHLRRGGFGGDFLETDLDDNLLIMAIRGEGMPLMPPKEPLSERQIRDFESWVAMGLPDPRTAEPRPPREAAPEMTIDWQTARQHWAFRPMRRVAATKVDHDTWSQSEIDRHLLAAMNEMDLHPNARADRASLLRRVSLDLTGLPPLADEVTAFLNDPRDDRSAFAAVVDRLLDSDHFGEHWGRHWLDVARYAESSGKDVNIFYPFAWRYRDYVIDALNDDKPYDDFLTEQIAGDLLPASDPEHRAELLVATGYLAIGPKSHSESDARQFLLDVVDEQIDAVSRGVMGITIACARCHDHKFDPISQQDYYSLAGIFASTEALFGGARTVQTNRTTGYVELPDHADVAVGESLSSRERESLERQLKMMARMGGGGMNPITLIRTANIKAKLSHYDDRGQPLKLAMSARDGQPIDLPVFLRGELSRPSDIVPRDFPQIIDGPAEQEIRSGSGRLELARWITDPKHPLTARVMANRVWQHLFGKGLVPTPDNFGNTGTPPSHPELLDHLALSLIDHDWSLKSLIRQVVNSQAYQMDTRANAKHMQIDPDNRFVWRQTRRRVTAESLRDAILVASGSFDPVPPVGSPVTRFGEGQTRVLDRQDMAGMMAGSRAAMFDGGRFGGGMFGGPRGQRGGMLRTMMQRRGGRFGRDMSRRPVIGYAAPSLDPRPNTRSVYLPVIRDRAIATLDAFDCPDASLVTGKRDTTTIASQSLLLMNDDFVIAQADAMADDLLRGQASSRGRIEAAFLRTLSRKPRVDEMKAAQSLLASLDHSKQAWSMLSQSLFATAEFRYTR